MLSARVRLLAALALPSAASLAFACGGEEPIPSTPAPPPPSGSVAALAPTPSAPAVVYDPNLKGPDETALDRSAAACDDFYQFACGGWMKGTPIPDDEASWVRSFSVIHEDNEKALRAILERDEKGDTQGDAYGKELGDFWASCSDETGLEKRSDEDLRPELRRIDAVHDLKSLTKELARLHSFGVMAGFTVGSEVDLKDSAHMIAGVAQGGLGLPERDYYFSDDPRKKGIRGEYEKHVARTFELLGDKPKAAEAEEKAVMKIETDLARASMTNVELRDPQKTYHRIDAEGLKKLAPDVPWDGYFADLGFPGLSAINVAQPDFFKNLDAMGKSGPMSDWRAYLRWQTTRAASPYLSQKFVDEAFHFRQVLTGAKSNLPRWKRCVRAIDEMMGEAIARPFVKDHLGEDGKKAAEHMVAEIEGSMKRDLEGLSWMDDSTRTKAEEKLAKVDNKIGYPAKWRSYDGLAIDRKSLLMNVAAARAFEVKRELNKVGKPVDKDEWEMTPPAVNAYYEPSMNEMVFPAGILQPPFYSKTQTPALNFGAIGMVVGHELTHGFDDEGRQFDAEGNLRDWWSPQVGAEFDRRTACVEHQYDEYVPIDDSHIKGKLTLGENIADLGGLKLSYASFERAEKEHPATSPMAGFSPEQQFFVGFAQSWCANYRPEALRLLVATNPHSPPRFRVMGPLSNLPEFASAFQCKEGSPMVRAAGKRCAVW